MRTPFLPVFVATAALFASCSRQALRVSDDAVPCANVMCTMEYRTLTVSLRDSTGGPVVLDSFHTTERSGVRLAPMYYAEEAKDGRYTVLNDGWAGSHRNTAADLLFLGFKDGREVVRQSFVVQADCCHISKKSGPDSVTVAL